MGSKLWLIAVLLLAVSVCYKALEAKNEDVKDKDVSKEGGNSQLCFEQICSSNPSNDLRGSDPLGSGAYGASRRGRRHKGIDIKCSASSNVYAPFPGKIVRESRPYGNGQPHDTGILMSGTGSWKGYSVKMHYVVKRVSNGVSISGGSYIGSMTNMKAYFRAGMTNHIHVQLYKNGRIINPTSYVC